MKFNPKYFPHIILIAYVVGVIIAILLGFIPEREGGEALFVPLTGAGYIKASLFVKLFHSENQKL